MNAIMNPAELRRKGIEILVRELGYANAMRFLHQYDTGRGDYTKERKEIFASWTLDDMIRESERLVALRKVEAQQGEPESESVGREQERRGSE